MKKIYLLTLLVPLLFLPIISWAQTSVGGLVTDGQGQPLPGVTILEDGTMNGTTSDLDGHYTIAVASKNATLTYSYIGYAEVSEVVGSRSVINVTLAESTSSLDEVVVVGYGVQKKVNLTGSVSSIDFSDMGDKRPIVNVGAALAGMAPGMNVSQGSGQPGADGATIRLRGVGSFTDSSSGPLVLVDGIEWGLNNINPNDIATISVLKDASSTAIYGTRAANGVILVTTKKGSKGKASITYDYGLITQSAKNNVKHVSNYVDYMNLYNESLYNIGKPNQFSDESIKAWEDAALDPNGVNAAGVPNHIAYPSTDWFNEMFQTGFSHKHNLSISGGSDKTTYMVSLGYLNNQGVMTRYNLDSSSQRYDVRANFEAKVTDWFTIGTRVFGQIQDQGMANLGSAFKYLSHTTPGIHIGTPMYWGVPALSAEESSNANNLFNAQSGRGGYDTETRVNSSLYAVLHPVKGLSVEGTFNYTPIFANSSVYTTQSGQWNYTTDTRHSTNTLDKATIKNSTSRSVKMSTELLARYNTTFGEDHDFGALVGYSVMQYENQGFSAEKLGATDWSLHELGTYAEMKSIGSTSPAGWGLRSYFGRVNYAYQSKYLFEANLRADGSSKFGVNTRYGYFPSFSGAWRVSEESFFEAIEESVSSAKLRLSWGQTGNNNGIGNYSWQANYNKDSVVVDGGQNTGLYISSLSNANLSWETTTTTNIGLDLGFFQNKLTAEIDAYNKMTTDILYTPSLHLTMGQVNGVPNNLGALRNSGVELALKWQDRVNDDFSYFINGNFSYNVNEVTKFKGELNKHWTYDENGNKLAYVNNLSDVAENRGGGKLCEGHMYGETYMRKLYRGSGAGYSGGEIDVNAGPKDGMIRTEADMMWAQAMIDSGYSFNGVTLLNKDQLYYGDLIYADLNNDGVYGNDNDQEFTGHSSLPKYNFGVNMGLEYKGFDFSMSWAGAAGFHLVWNTEYYNRSRVSSGCAINERVANDHYFFDVNNPEDSRTNIDGTYPRLVNGSANSNDIVSDFYEYKGDYFKLKNIQIGYTIPSRITRKLCINRLRAYASADNLLTITKYPGLDPEIGTYVGYPIMRQVSLGVQLSF